MESVADWKMKTLGPITAEPMKMMPGKIIKGIFFGSRISIASSGLAIMVSEKFLWTERMADKLL
jgi:hypothetical protein